MKKNQFRLLTLTGMLATALLLSCGQQTKETRDSKLSKYFQYKEGKEVLISAHRGGKGYHGYPENCLGTMEYVYKEIPNAIYEVDVAQTMDSVLILMHDNSVDRTSTGKDYVDKLTWEEIKQYRLIDDFGDTTGFRAPLFSEVLKWADSLDVILMVDIKKTVDPAIVIDYIEKFKAEDNAVVITYSVDAAKNIYKLNNKLMLSVSIRNMDELDRMEQSGIPFANMVAFTGTRESGEELYKAVHKKGVMCIFGTLGNIDKKAASKKGEAGNAIYQELVKKGVDIFATDRALEVYKAVK